MPSLLLHSHATMNCHCLTAYNSIMIWLQAGRHTVDLQVLDNKASTKYKRTITQTWKAKHQHVPPDMHCRNAAKCGTCTFKDNFIAIPASVDTSFPNSRWDLLIPHTELTLNQLR
jgi:hypothetical protein